MFLKKLAVLIVITLMAVLLAGTYGIIHDQITYSISHEYFTKFKFVQFHIYQDELQVPLRNPRLIVAKIGFLATWWVGLLVGLSQSITGLIFKNTRTMIRIVSKAIILNLFITFLFGVAGYIYGEFLLRKIPENWFQPENLVNIQRYLIVGSIHNFGYLGGVAGLVAGMIFQIYSSQTERSKHSTSKSYFSNSEKN